MRSPRTITARPSAPCVFFNDTATTEIYTLSLHDALPIWTSRVYRSRAGSSRSSGGPAPGSTGARSEEHTSELQSLQHLVCRLLLEKKQETASDRERITSPGDTECFVGSNVRAPQASRDGAEAAGRQTDPPWTVGLLAFFFNDRAPPGIYPLPLRAPFRI